MFRVFNMGIGFVVVVPRARAADASRAALEGGRARVPDRRDRTGSRGVEYR